jgi:hypothetical protein
MIPQEREEISDEELWKTIPFEKQIEIDIAIDKGNKAEAINRCMCSSKDFTFSGAVGFMSEEKKFCRKKY